MIMASTVGSRLPDLQKALSGAYHGEMSLVIPDVLEESCTTRQALQRFASKWRILVIYARSPSRYGTRSCAAGWPESPRRY